VSPVNLSRSACPVDRGSGLPLGGQCGSTVDWPARSTARIVRIGRPSTAVARTSGLLTVAVIESGRRVRRADHRRPPQPSGRRRRWVGCVSADV